MLGAAWFTLVLLALVRLGARLPCSTVPTRLLVLNKYEAGKVYDDNDYNDYKQANDHG